MSRKLRSVSGAFAIVAVLTCCGALISRGLAGGGEAVHSGGVFFEDSAKTFGEVSVGTNFRMAFRLTNRSGRDVKLLGASTACFEAGCLGTVGLPLELAADTTCDVVVHVVTRAPRSFKGQISVYTDHPGSGTLPLTVEGEVSGSTK
jgi:hypothetical protein